MVLKCVTIIETQTRVTAKIVNMKNKATLDTRKFGEIYESLTEDEKSRMREMIMDRTGYTDSAIRNWRLRNRIPRITMQYKVLDVMRSFGIRTNIRLLFPPKPRKKRQSRTTITTVNE